MKAMQLIFCLVVLSTATHAQCPCRKHNLQGLSFAGKPRETVKPISENIPEGSMKERRVLIDSIGGMNVHQKIK